MDVQFFNYKNKRKLERVLATQPGVQDKLKAYADGRAEVARGILSAHVFNGHSKITVEHGKVDWHVVLNDERGQQAAAAIEFGTWRSQGVWALHRAFAVSVSKRGGF